MPTRRTALADVYSNLKAVMMALSKQMEASLSRSGMSAAQMMVLWLLVEEGSATPKALSKRLGVTPGNITRLVEKLEVLGYATRTRSREDLRVVHVQATREGSAAIQGGFDAQARVLTAAFGDWSDRELGAFRAMLARLVPRQPKPPRREGKAAPASRRRPAAPRPRRALAVDSAVDTGGA